MDDEESGPRGLAYLAILYEVLRVEPQSPGERFK
jgi:hypothetical protein